MTRVIRDTKFRADNGRDPTAGPQVSAKAVGGGPRATTLASGQVVRETAAAEPQVEADAGAPRDRRRGPVPSTD